MHVCSKGDQKGGQNERPQFMAYLRISCSMEIIVIIEKTSQNFSMFIDLLKNQAEIRQNEITKRLSRASYFGVIMKRVFNINKALREFDSALYLAEPSFSISPTNSVFTSIKRCPLIEIESKKEVYVVRCKHGRENKDNSSKGKQRSISTHTE